MVVLGGVRMTGPQEYGKRYQTRPARRRTPNIKQARIRQDHKIHYPEQWKAAKSFVKNACVSLGEVYCVTPIGHVALAEKESDLYAFRERCLTTAAIHNSRHRYWQVLVELSWADLGPEALSTLVMLSGEALPEEFWK